MKIIAKLLVLIGTLVMPFAHASFGHSELVFICHKGLGYHADTVKKAYGAWLDEPKLVDNRTLLPKLMQYLGVSQEKYRRYWTKNFFRRAINPPQLRDNDEQVVAFVASHDQGVGYVSKRPSNPDVEVCGLE